MYKMSQFDTTNAIINFDRSIGSGGGASFPQITVISASGTILLTPEMNRATFILTGTNATQQFNSTGLVGVAPGWTLYLRNGNNTTGTAKDITISINGSATLHTITNTTNSSEMLLYWDGTTIVKYL
jgi:hypothetical protein